MKCKDCDKEMEWSYNGEAYCDNHVPIRKVMRFFYLYILPLFTLHRFW